MITKSIADLKECGGSSRQAILKYIMANFQVGNDAKIVNMHLRQALKRCLANGIVGHHNIVTICIDAEDYSDCPLKQYEEDNILRELNKSYLGYCDVYKPLQNPENSQLLIRRSQLKPIKDEVAPEKSDKKQYFTETVKAGLPTKNSCPVVIAMIPKKSVASKETTKKCAAKDKGEMSRSNVDDVTCRRRPSLVELSDTHKSIYKTCNSELDDFKSANSSLDVE
ncbi:hypothetical protein QYM36_006565, partial [Artemia franciscana]